MRINPPVDPAFRVGEIGLGYDQTRDRVVLFVREVQAEEQDERTRESSDGDGLSLLVHAYAAAQAGTLGGGDRQPRPADLPAMRSAHGARRSLLPEEERAYALKPGGP